MPITEISVEITPTSLRNLRDIRGYSGPYVARELTRILGRDKEIDVSTIYKHEYQGVRDIDVLKALALIYDVDLAIIDQLAKHS